MRTILSGGCLNQTSIDDSILRPTNTWRTQAFRYQDTWNGTLHSGGPNGTLILVLHVILLEETLEHLSLYYIRSNHGDASRILTDSCTLAAVEASTWRKSLDKRTSYGICRMRLFSKNKFAHSFNEASSNWNLIEKWSWYVNGDRLAILSLEDLPRSSISRLLQITK